MSLRLFLAVPIPQGIADRLLTLEADVPSDQMAGLNLANTARVLVAVPADKVMAYPHG